MKPRLYETPLGKFEEAQYPGGNHSGFRPIGEFVLVLFDKSPEKTAGGILLADTTKENNSAAAEAGVIIELGDDAFKWNYDRSRPFNGRRPQPGDRIFFERYAGSEIHGRDGVKYRLMQDRCVAAVAAISIDAEVEETTEKLIPLMQHIEVMTSVDYPETAA